MSLDNQGNCVPSANSPTGSIKISAFQCSSTPILSRSVNGPNAQGAFTAPSVCTPLSGQEFGSVFLPGIYNGGGGYPFINGEGLFDVLGITGSNGELIKSGLSTLGRYDIAETYTGGNHLPNSNQYALFCYGDTGTWNDNLDYTFVPANRFTYCVSYRTNDVCPNIPGNQGLVPEGAYIDNQNNCIFPNPTDLCPNIAGNQTTIPDGKVLNSAEQCVNVIIPDACPNIVGYQASVSSDMKYDELGNCVPLNNIIDLCPNIPGNQTTLPAGKVLNTVGQCVDIKTPDACPNISGTQTDIPSGYIYDLSDNCIPISGFPTDVCPNIAGDQSTVPSGMTIDTGGNCISDFCVTNPDQCTPPPDACAIDPASCVPSLDYCTVNPTLCTKPPNACSIDPSICSSSSSFCTKHPTLCTPPADACSTDPALCVPLKNFCAINPKLCQAPFIGKIYNILSNIADLLPMEVTKFVKQNEKIIVGVGASGLFSFLFSNFARLWQWLLWLFGFAKRRKKWGTVYDSVTKYPLDPAYVVASDMAGNTMAESITDLDGRYGFLLQPGSYKIVANKTNYKFPSERLARVPVDEVYSDLYFGEVINIESREQVIAKNIPMDPIGFDWNEAEKHRTRLGTYSREIWLRRLFGTIFYIGFAISLISFLLTLSILYFTILCAYIILYFVQGYSSMGGSGVYYLGTKTPVSYAIITLYANVDKRRVMKKVTSSEGKFFALLPNSYYYLTVETKNTDGSYSLAHTSKVFKVKHGFVNEKVFI